MKKTVLFSTTVKNLFDSFAQSFINTPFPFIINSKALTGQPGEKQTAPPGIVLSGPKRKVAEHRLPHRKKSFSAI
jgi:hypothetical protein